MPGTLAPFLAVVFLGLSLSPFHFIPERDQVPEDPWKIIEGETQVVEDRVGLEQVAVVLGNAIQRVALVDRAEEELKGLPRGQAGNPHEGRVLEQVSVGEQAPDPRAKAMKRIRSSRR